MVVLEKKSGTKEKEKVVKAKEEAAKDAKEVVFRGKKGR